MDPTNGSGNGGSAPHPPPYDPQDYGQSCYSGMSYQVGKGNVAVVSPAGPYDNAAHPEDMAAAGGDYCHDLEDSSFSNSAIRRGFIRKVYLTLMLQLLVTVGIICAFLYWEALRKWTRANSWFSFTTMAMVIVLIVALSCCDNLRRQVPLNFIALGLFTIAEGLMLGAATVYFDAEAVLWAVGATALVSFALTLFAVQSKTTLDGQSKAPRVIRVSHFPLQSVALHITASTRETFSLLTFMAKMSLHERCSVHGFLRLIFQCLLSSPHSLASVGLHRTEREPVGVDVDPLFLWIAMWNPPIPVSLHRIRLPGNLAVFFILGV
ncbi:protein lifeguard 3 isoform 2-T2 [Spinachia spinachia]